MLENGESRKRRQLTPQKKWEIFLEVKPRRISFNASESRSFSSLSNSSSTSCTDAWRPGFADANAASAASFANARKRMITLTSTPYFRAASACEIYGSRADPAPGKATLGLLGPVPARVSAEIKLELLGLIDQAVADGWAHARACRVLDLADSRAHHWRQRLRETGTLEDRDPVSLQRVSGSGSRVPAWCMESCVRGSS